MMNLIDMRTIILSYTFSNAICATVMALLWVQNRRHIAGLGFWLADFIMQFAGIVLIALRGIVPDLLSMVVSNSLLVLGTLLLYIGLEQFVRKRSSQIHNAVLLVIFIVAHTYFSVIQPNLAARTINLSLALLMLCAQAAWLMLYRADDEMRQITRRVGMVLAALCTISAALILIELVTPSGNDFFHPPLYEAVAILTYQTLFIILTFSLVLMVNHRLFADLERDIAKRQQVEEALRLSEEKFSKAFHSSPDAILITRLSDGRLVEVNEGFCRMAEYSHEEALSRITTSLGIWANPQDREHFTAAVQERQRVDEAEYEFRTKSGKIVNGLLSGEIIYLDQEPHILGVVRDVTERRQAEEIVRLRLRLWEYAATHSVDELMQKALDEIGDLTSSPIGFYHFVEEDQNTLSLHAWSTRTLEIFCEAEGKGLHYNISEAGVWVDCVHQRKPVIHNNYAALPHRKGLPEGHAEIVRELVVPTMRNDRVVSILGVGNKPSDYNQQDVELVAYVADIVFSIVESKRAEEALRLTNAELETRNAELDAFGHTVAHDLKGPLSTIIGFAYLLEDKENPASEAETAQMVQLIRQQASKMNNIIEELMLLAGLRKADVTMQPLDMAHIAGESLGRLAQQIKEAQAQIVCPTSWPLVLGYAPWVEEIWVNYISNAIKYGGRPPQVELGAA